MKRNTYLKLVALLSIVFFLGISFIDNVNETKRNRLRELDPKVEKLKLLPDFKAEHLYSPSESKNGSWVAMTFDQKGRMIACDQYGYLYRLTIPPIGTESVKSKIIVERLEIKVEGDTTKEKIKMGYAQGLLYSFNSLYVMVNHKADTAMAKSSGLYRLQDTDNDDQYDKITLLKDMVTPGGEHGPHSMVISPDKKSIHIIAGNHVDVPKMDAYRLPETWKEDNLFPLIKDPNGHANDRAAPGGFIAKINPEGTNWELISAGYRNAFDLAFNEVGDMFVYDADMEWDFGMPWYRPTRISHSTSGSEFGWRTGNSKWSPAYPDNLPAILNIGQGSPTSLFSGNHARFPEKYRRGLFAFDWSFGIIYAVHLTPIGSSYKASAEEFISGAPLPLTDGIIGPDGAMYFLTGGRKLDSDLYRVYYGENTLPNTPLITKTPPDILMARNLRRQLEAFHGDPNSNAITLAWPNLKNKDRYIRYAARMAVEHQPVSQWQEKAFLEKDPQILTQAMVAMARVGTRSLQVRMINSLMKINFAQLPESQQIDVLRAYELIISRMEKPYDAQKILLSKYLNQFYPSKSNELNRSFSKILVALDDPLVVQKTIALLDGAVQDPDDQKTFMQSSDLILRNPQYGLDIAGMLAKTPPAQQIYYVTVLSEAKNGWTTALREKYFKWYYTAFGYKGGNSFIGFIDKARKMALAHVPQDQFEHYNKISGNELLTNNGMKLASVGSPKGPGRNWKLDDALEVVLKDSTNRNFEQGEMLFSATRCISCHSMKGEGGAVGPALSQLGTRFSARDILESILEPNKVISDQYAYTSYYLRDGGSVTGRLKNEDSEKYYISQNPFAPQTLREVIKRDVVRTRISDVSSMYPGMINGLNKEELKDLMAYLISGSNKDHQVYKPKSK
ncbi:MAG: c-type cytochrome [Bacteroidetes bacterium]|nr:c-type cytochrome [Bacteroidota bacterium]